jgi:HEPN domain-containing protein
MGALVAIVKPGLRREARLWWEQGLKDLEVARRLLEGGDYNYAAFLAHQAVEKALKAAIIEIRGELPPKLHNLVELGQPLQDAGLPLEEILDDLKDLNPHYLTSRYPDAANGLPSETYSRRMGEACIGIAARVIDWLQERLRE